MMQNHMPLMFLALALLGSPLIALAQSTSDPDPTVEPDTLGDWPSWNFTLGGTWLEADGIYSLDIPDFGNVPILDFDTIGLDKRDTSYYLAINWRAKTRRWGAGFSSWGFSATGNRAWSVDVPVDGVEIPVGASVTSKFDAKFYILDVSYSLFRSDSVDAGIGLGIHAVDLETNLLATVNVGELEGRVIDAKLDALAPLPNVVAYGTWRFGERWILSGRAGWFGLDFDKYSGDMGTAQAQLDFHITQNWALGLGYQFVSFDVSIDEIESEGYTEVYDIDFQGPTATLSYRF